MKSRSCVLAPRVCGTELRQAEDTLKLYKRSNTGGVKITSWFSRMCRRCPCRYSYTIDCAMTSATWLLTL
eukprot:COSAG01_NODE_2022_length_8630_cov_16.836010_7_plen_70_part_00